MAVLRRLTALLALMLALTSAAMSAEVAIPPSPARWATDTAGFLKAQTVAALDARLEAYQSQTGHQLLVYVTPTTGDTPTEDWTVRAFARWKAGRKGLDDGLILFVFPTDHKVRIEVGYGLEQSVPDAVAARIIGTMTPKIRAGRQDDAVTSGVDQLIAAIGGSSSSGAAASGGKSGASSAVSTPSGAESPGDTESDPLGDAIVIIGGLLIVGVIIWMLVKQSPRGPYIGRRRGGFGLAGYVIGAALGGISGGGGGGFSGGGGMSGGGGATGSW